MRTKQIALWTLGPVLMVIAAQAPADPPKAPAVEPDRMGGAIAAELATPQPSRLAAESVVAAPILDSNARRISFQGLITTSQGNPIPQPNGDHTFDFFFYGSEMGGAPIGSVLNVVITLEQGIASTQVGPLDPTWFDGTARWMGITVDDDDDDPAGDELDPRIPLTSVPYAFRVDRVLSEELADDIALGDPGTAVSGSLQIYSGALATVSISADGPTGQLGVYDPASQGRIVLHGQGQLIETRDDADTLVALYGYDALGGGAACLLGTAAGTAGLLLDGDQTGGGGGHIVLYDDTSVDAISLIASSATVRVGSQTAGGASGNLHLYPTTGAPSRIHLDGQDADLRLGLTGDSSGDLRLYSSGGGIERIHLSGSNGHISATDGTIETVRLDGSGGDGGGGILLWNSAGTQTVELDADEADNPAIRLNNASGSTAIMLDGSPARIGIGTGSPDHELVVQGDDPAMQIRDDTTDNSANAARLELLERSGGAFDGGAFLWWNGETNKLLVGTKQSGVNTNVLVVDRATSSVGIGTQNPGSYRLAVNGPVRAKEIVVDTGWSDFVFEPDYKLASLEEVEAHIRQHGHLPDIPSAKEVEEHGVKVGEMESKLLQKVEELTLHLIEMNKRVQLLEKENARLRESSMQPTSPEGSETE